MDKTIKKILSRTKKEGDCFIWVGPTTRNGYGRTYYRCKKRLVHKLAAHLFRGAPLDDETIFTLHKPECKSKACWNPEHTYEGTHSDNMKDRSRAGNDPLSRYWGDKTRR